VNTFRDLARRAEGLRAPELDVDGLVARGERRLRRRRVIVAVSAAAAVVVLAVGGVLVDASLPKARGPIDRPTHPDQTANPVTRRIVYSDSPLFEHTSGSVHWGDHAVETGDGFVHMDVTDDGFIYTSDGRAWFSDGGTPLRIGSHMCGAAQSGEFSDFAHRSVMSANAGTLAAWFDCTDVARPSLVVYDTSSRREVARRPIKSCRRSCELVDITADYVYFDRGVYTGFPRPEYRFGISTRRLGESTPQLYAEDLVTHPRGLAVGDTWQRSAATSGIGQAFVAVGPRLVPVRPGNGELTKAFDTATRHPVRLRLPLRYHAARTGDFRLFEWLDDRTVALVADGDLLTCHLSNGRCDLSVERAGGAHGQEAPHRIVPNLPLPG
jgi:hypothetical protein